jgi:AcrR family transcriptional regulator
LDRRLARTPEDTTPLSTKSQVGAAAPEVAPGATAPFERNGSSTRRRVIEAGARVFADLGFHAATKERIGAAAGFSHQTVRDYFRTKEGLLGAIVADAWRTVLTAMAATPNASPLEQIMAGYDALEGMTRARPAEARCVLHESQIAGPKGGPLHVAEELGFKRGVEQVITAATGMRGAAAVARAEVIIAAMEALTRPNVIQAEQDNGSKYTPEEARSSFRMLAESMLQRVS